MYQLNIEIDCWRCRASRSPNVEVFCFRRKSRSDAPTLLLDGLDSSCSSPLMSGLTTVQVDSPTQYNAAVSLPPPQSVNSDPLEQFKAWFTEASSESSPVPEPSMVLFTCTPDGVPSSCQVLLKQADAKGFAFYTNYTSRTSRAKMILGVGVHLLGAYNAREHSLVCSN